MKIENLNANVPKMTALGEKIRVRSELVLNSHSGLFEFRVPKVFLDRLGGSKDKTAQSLLSARDEWAKLVEAYTTSVTSAASEKVIVISYLRKRNDPCPQGFRSSFYETSSNEIPQFALAFDYEVLSRLDGALYRQEFEGAELEYVGCAKSTSTRMVVPWTEKAENTLKNMTESFQGAIEYLDGFLSPEEVERSLSDQSDALLVFDLSSDRELEA